MTQFKVGDRVRHREDDKIGEVYGVHPSTVWVLWKGQGVPAHTMPSNLIPLPFKEGDYVIHKSPTGRTVYGVGEVLSVSDEFLWVSWEKSATQPTTIKQDAAERTSARRLAELPAFAVGVQVRSKNDSGLRFMGTVLGADGSQIWVKMSNGNYITLRQDLLELG